MPTMSMSASGGEADIPDTPHQCPLMTHSGQCVCARRTKVVASCAPAARQWSASYPRSFAMITVSPAAVSATSNTMIKGAPRATPIRPTKTPIKRHSTIRVGAPKIIDFLHQKNLCDWLRLGQRRIAGCCTEIWAIPNDDGERDTSSARSFLRSSERPRNLGLQAGHGFDSDSHCALWIPAAAAVGASDDLKEMAIGILEINAAPAIVMIDLALLRSRGIGPIGERPFADPTEDLVKI
jgi:hypothetical protein